MSFESLLLDPDWQPMPLRARVPVSSEILGLQCLSDLLEAAEVAAAGFDFLRVDLYSKGQVYLGEVTAYAGGGLEPFEPRTPISKSVMPGGCHHCLAPEATASHTHLPPERKPHTETSGGGEVPGEGRALGLMTRIA